MDSINLAKEDIDSIVYEVVNAKAASAENKNKKHQNHFHEREELFPIRLLMQI